MELFFVIALEDRFNENINIGKCLLVHLAKKFFDFGHSGCRQGPISAKKRFAQNGGLPEYFFLAPIMYQDLFSNISKIWDVVFCLRKIILKRSAKNS